MGRMVPGESSTLPRWWRASFAGASLASAAILVMTACSRDEAASRRGPEPLPAAASAARPGSDALAFVTAEQLRAKVRRLSAPAVLVNAWATWCGSCEHELPMLQKLADALAPRGVRVLLVSVDGPDDDAVEGQDGEAKAGAKDPRARAQAFLADHGIRLTSYVAAPPLDQFVPGMSPRWPGMLPASFLFDRTGRLRYFWGGEAFEKELVPVIEGLLAGKAIDGETRFDLAPGQTTDPR